MSANSAPHERANDSEWDQYLFSCDKTKLKIRGGGGQFVDKMLFDIPIYFYYSIFILRKILYYNIDTVYIIILILQYRYILQINSVLFNWKKI